MAKTRNSKTEPAPASSTPDTRTRLLTAAQTTGRLGKSTLLTTLATWASFAELPWAGVDADPANRTFSDVLNSRGDARIATLPINQPQSLDAIFRHANSAPVCLVDFPAGATDLILQHMEAKRTLEGFAEKGVRMTIFLFASPDETAEASMRDLVSNLRGHADFIVVKNDARFSSERFMRSRAAKTLEEMGAPTITMPSISSFTFRDIQSAEARLQKILALPDAVDHVSIDSRLDIEYFLNSLYRQFEDAGTKLLPPGVRVRNTVPRTEKAEPVRASRFADPLDF